MTPISSIDHFLTISTTVLHHIFLLFACKLLLKTSWQSENKCLGVPCNTYLSTNTYSSRRVREKFLIKKFWPFFNIKKREPLCVNINTKLLFFFNTRKWYMLVNSIPKNDLFEYCTKSKPNSHLRKIQFQCVIQYYLSWLSFDTSCPKINWWWKSVYIAAVHLLWAHIFTVFT